MTRLLKILILIASFHSIESVNAQNFLKSDASPSASSAQTGTPTTTVAPCPAPLEVSTAHLYGIWHVTFHDGALPSDDAIDANRQVSARTTILFERHPEHDDSLRGAMKPIGSAQSPSATGTVWLSGDLEDGELILDESDNGQRISAVWVAHPSAKGCGKVFKGNRRLADSDTLQTFVMTKAASWR